MRALARDLLMRPGVMTLTYLVPGLVMGLLVTIGLRRALSRPDQRSQELLKHDHRSFDTISKRYCE